MLICYEDQFAASKYIPYIKKEQEINLINVCELYIPEEQRL